MPVHLFTARLIDARERSVASHAIAIISKLKRSPCLHLFHVPGWYTSTRPGRPSGMQTSAAAACTYYIIPVQLLAPKQCFAGARVGCFDVGEYVCPLVVGDVVDGTAANTVHRMHHALNCYDISIQCHTVKTYSVHGCRNIIEMSVI